MGGGKGPVEGPVPASTRGNSRARAHLRIEPPHVRFPQRLPGAPTQSLRLPRVLRQGVQCLLPRPLRGLLVGEGYHARGLVLRVQELREAVAEMPVVALP
jgi:hypothetical protein